MPGRGSTKARKAKLLKNLRQHTYVRLKPSNIDGVGVFAIRTIPKGTNPFQTCWPTPSAGLDHARYTELSRGEVNSAPSVVKKYVNDFVIPDAKGIHLIPSGGMNTLDISFYLNHSVTPNLEIVNDKNDCYYGFRAKENIPPGVECTIDYNRYIEPSDKQHRPKKSRAHASRKKR